jgi:hypothetical protein
LSSAAAFERFLDIMLPGGGCVVTFTEVYIDESYRDGGPPILCLAGYVYLKDEAAKFSRSWAEYLALKGLPYFHMSECNAKKKNFKDRTDTDEIGRELIRRIKESTAFGFGVTVNEDDYAKHVQPREGLPMSAYAFALASCMTMVRKWKERSGITGPTAFFFEEGHKSQGEANNFITWLFESERLRRLYGYSGHAFVLKETPGLHPADMLAWHWSLEVMRQHEATRTFPPRQDLIALLRPTDMVQDYTLRDMREMESTLTQSEQERARIIREALATGVVPAMFE